MSGGSEKMASVSMSRGKALAALGVAVCALVPSLAQAQASPSSYTSAVRYDAMRRVTGTIAPDPDGGGALKFAAVRNSYDGKGRLIKVEAGELSSWQSESVAPSAWSGFTILSTKEISYDNLWRKTLEIAKGSDGVAVSAMQYSYDNMNRLECTAARLNPAIYGSLPASACTLGTEGSHGPDRITKNVYDAAGQLLKVQKAFGTAIQQDYATYTYTTNGKPASVKDANSNLAQYTYDGHDRQTRWTFPSKTSAGSVNASDYEEYGYDANGNRTSLRKRHGSTIGFTYDALNRATIKDVDATNVRSDLAATHKRDVYYGYDLRGLQTFARFDSASGEGLTTSYDGFGRQTSSTLTMDGVARTLGHLPDAGGRRIELTHPDGQKFAYSYDEYDRLILLRENWTNWLRGFSYTNRGSPTGASHAAGAAGMTYYGYDAVGRVSSISHDIAGSGQDVSYGYGYSPASQLVSRTTSNDTYVYAGDVNVSRSYAANGLNQYDSAGPRCFEYDGNGNLTADKNCASPNDASRTNYLYDVENRLVAASGATSASLRYDPIGRLYETGTSLTPNGATTRFLYDGDELIAEYNSSGTLLRRYVHGASVDDPVAWYEGSNLSQLRFVHANHQGSITAVTDADGAALAVNAYDDYGIPASTNIGRFQYTGQAWLPELGMYHYKARIYSPTLGRFLQTDPIGYKDQMNLYAYVGNNPVNMRDPMGTCHGPARPPTGSVAADNCRLLEIVVQQQRMRVAGERRPQVERPSVTTVAGAAATAATKTPRNVTVDTRLNVRTGGAQGQAFHGNQHVSAASAASVADRLGKGVGLLGFGADLNDQINDGTPIDQAVVNSGSKAAFSAAVGTIMVAMTPETLGGSAIVGAAVLAADHYFGGAVGNFAEAYYVIVRDSAPPDDLPLSP